MECIEKIIKKDMIDPTNGRKMTDKDIIPLQRVCTPVLSVRQINRKPFVLQFIVTVNGIFYITKLLAWLVGGLA